MFIDITGERFDRLSALEFVKHPDGHLAVHGSHSATLAIAHDQQLRGTTAESLALAVRLVPTAALRYI